MATSSALYSAFLVQEREQNLKKSLMAMGCRPLAYWTGALVFDFACFLVLALLVIGLGAIL